MPPFQTPPLPWRDFEWRMPTPWLQARRFNQKRHNPIHISPLPSRRWLYQRTVRHRIRGPLTCPSASQLLKQSVANFQKTVYICNGWLEQCHRTATPIGQGMVAMTKELKALLSDIRGSKDSDAVRTHLTEIKAKQAAATDPDVVRVLQDAQV